MASSTRASRNGPAAAGRAPVQRSPAYSRVEQLLEPATSA